MAASGDFAMNAILTRREKDLDDAKAERKDAKARLGAAEKALADNKDPAETADLKAAVARAGRMLEMAMATEKEAMEAIRS